MIASRKSPVTFSTRRSFLKGLAATTAYAGNGARSAFPQPAIVKAELTPQAFGATGGDSAADTLAWNRAIAEAAGSGRPVIGQGTYVLQVPAVSRWNWARRPSSPARVAVAVRSDVDVFGKDVEIILAQPAVKPAPDERHIIFGTELNAVSGTLKNITFDGITFDFREEFGPIHPYTYAIGAIGVDNLVRRNLRIRSSGSRAGRGLIAENIRGRSDRDIRHDNIVQGIYTRYEHSVTMERITFDGFVEALDFDGPCWDVNLNDMKFRNGFGEAQCIDTGGGANWNISNIEAENVGSILFIYVKPNAWPSYEEFLSNAFQPTVTCVIPENIAARHVIGRNAGRKQRNQEALRVGNRRKAGSAWPTVSPPRNITLEDWHLEGGYHAIVNECLDLRINDVSLKDTDTPVDKSIGAALAVRQGRRDFGGWISGSITDINIKNSYGMGLSAIASPDLEIRNVTVDGFNRRGASETGAGVRVRGIANSRPPRVRDLHVVHNHNRSEGMDLDLQNDQGAR